MSVVIERPVVGVKEAVRILSEIEETLIDTQFMHFVGQAKNLIAVMKVLEKWEAHAGKGAKVALFFSENDVKITDKDTEAPKTPKTEHFDKPQKEKKTTLWDVLWN